MQLHPTAIHEVFAFPPLQFEFSIALQGERRRLARNGLSGHMRFGANIFTRNLVGVPGCFSGPSQRAQSDEKHSGGSADNC
jgi:hypothetical protein